MHFDMRLLFQEYLEVIIQFTNHEEMLYICFRKIMMSLHGQVAEHHHTYIIFAEIIPCLWLNPLVRTLPELPDNRL